MASAPFSRIALAAALLEYDNESEDPHAVKRSASESAIFSHLRRSGPVPKPESVLDYDDLPQPRRSKDYLGVALPNDQGSVIMRPRSESNFGVGSIRQSFDGRRSLDILREQGEQYFQSAEPSETSSVDDVDLTSWGLDSLIPPKTHSANEKLERKPGPGRIRPASEHLDNLPNPHSPQSSAGHDQMGPASLNRRRSAVRASTISTDFGINSGFGFLESPGESSTFPLTARRHTVLFPEDHAATIGSSSSARLPPQTIADMLPATIPVPPSPTQSQLDLLDQEEDPAFAVPLPPPERMSRFDPKAAKRARTTSGSSWVSEFGLKPPVDDRVRTYSNASMGSRGLVETAAADVAPSIRQSIAPTEGDQRRLSRMELMRPKFLIMPGPLRDIADPAPTSRKIVPGFEDSTGDRPLPAGFRTSVSSKAGLRPQSFAPNPRMSMSASQLMFRNSLMVGGERDVSYIDMDQRIRRAHEEGEKIEDEEDPDEVEAAYRELQHPTGKLLGHSLMDALEARKNEIKGKRRVFRGDDRPSMMERGLKRNTTLIDPESLNMPQIAVVDGDGRPILQKPEPTRRISDRDKRASGMPLVDLNGGDQMRSTNRLPQSRSVFGVDTVWERELSKLEKMEQVERREEEERRRMEQNKHKKGSKSTRRASTNQSTPSPRDEEPPLTSGAGGSQEPPTLPEVATVTSRARPRPPKLEGSDDEGHGNVERRRTSTATLGVKGWFAGSSDDEDEKRPAPRGPSGAYRTSPAAAARTSRLAAVVDDSDEDVPLSAQIERVKMVAQTLRPPDDSDEDEPLAAILESKGKGKTALIPSVGASGGVISPSTSSPVLISPPKAGDDDDDDDVPLGLRAPPTAFASPSLFSSLPSPGAHSKGDDDEDDDEKPLGLRLAGGAPPSVEEQQRQYQAMLLQQQQQQMYVQAQMAHASMTNFPSMGGGIPMMSTGGGFIPPNPFGGHAPAASLSMPAPFGPAGGMPMMPNMTGVSMTNPDAAKIGRVDAWRQGVAGGT